MFCTRMTPQVLLPFLLCFVPDPSAAYCWQAGKNPGFSGPPRVRQLSITKVRVSWDGLVTQEDCADNYVVKFWPTQAPSTYKITDIVPVNQHSVDIEVQPRVRYQFQAVAREEKGPVSGVDWNKSLPTTFATSSSAAEISDTSFEDASETDEVAQEETNIGKVSRTKDDAPVRVLGLRIEMFFVVVLAVLILLLITAGTIHRLYSSRKKDSTEDSEMSSDDDDEDLDDDEEARVPFKGSLNLEIQPSSNK